MVLIIMGNAGFTTINRMKAPTVPHSTPPTVEFLSILGVTALAGGGGGGGGVGFRVQGFRVSGLGGGGCGLTCRVIQYPFLFIHL